VTAEQVRRVMDAPPYWLAGSYIPAYKSGRISTTALAYAATAGPSYSPHDSATVDEVARHLEHLGYGDEVAAVWV
jgi:hypothetical protein